MLGELKRIAEWKTREAHHEIPEITAVRLKLEQNQLVDVFDEIRVSIDGLEGA